MYQRIAVIGAGALGRRIAWTLGKNAVSVHLCDTSETALEAARSYFNEQSNQLDGVSDRSSRIFTTVSLSEAVGDADLIVESIPEDLAAKRSLFLQLEENSTPNSVLATNSSSYPSRLLLEDESPLGLRTLNTHFYAPPEQPAVELMSTGKTDPEIVAAVAQFFVDLGLRPFIAQAESVGFIYNRIWAAIKRESLSVVAEGVATPQEVDELFALCVSPLGPFRTMDFVGLDTVLDIENHYIEAHNELGTTARDLVQKYVTDGHLGFKTKRGFYSDYF